MAKYGVQLRDANGDSLYPRTIIEQIYNMAGSARLDVLLSTMRENLEGDIADTNLAVARLREDLNALLSNATLSGAILDAIVEIKTLLESNSSDVVEELVTTMSALRDEAIRNVAQELTLSQKQQARTNVGAVGVKYTDNRGAHLEQAGTEIMPYTKAEYVEYRGSNLDAVVNVLDERSSETKEKVDAFLVDADTSEQALDKLKELQDYIKNDETSASQMLGDIAQNKQDIADNAEALEKEATRAKQVEMYLESQKADKYGYYENLSVGVSDNLSGRGEATESEFSFRPSGGENKSIPEDGTARINSIKGNSVVWNQLVKLHHIKTTLSPGVAFNLNIIKFEYGHKYLFLKTQSFPHGVYFQSDGNVGLCRLSGDVNSNIMEMTSTIEINTAAFIYNTKAEDVEIDTYIKVIDLTKMFNGVNVPTTVEEFESLYGNMPNEYNEGTIIDNHTTAIKSVGVNAWDEEWEVGAYNIWNEDGDGSKVDINGYTRCKNHIPVIPNMTYSISAQSYASQYHVGFYDGDKNYIAFATFIQQTSGYRTFTTPPYCHYITFYTNHATYNHDICIHLVHTGYLNGKYFPYESQTRQLPTVEGGLKSAGTACDEIRYNKGKDKWEHVPRVGIVDLGTLEWYYGNPSGNAKKVFYSENVKTKLSITPAQGDSLKSNILSVNYTSKTPYDTLVVETVNKAITAWTNQAELYRIVVADTAYTDVATFKQAMQGVILYYELAEPVVTELDVDISPDYKVWDYGTEEAISEVLSTPVRTNTNYGFNAVGQITDNTELIKELLVRVAVLEAQIAQANSANVNVEPIVE